MTSRTASCSCGQLRLICEGEPVRVSICHCLDCQKRTGSVFAAQARYPRNHVTMSGLASHWSRTGDSGGTSRFSLCPECGSTVFWEPDTMPKFIVVAVGAFADLAFRSQRWPPTKTGSIPGRPQSGRCRSSVTNKDWRCS